MFDVGSWKFDVLIPVSLNPSIPKIPAIPDIE